MIYKNKPINFNSKFEIASCFVEYDRKILLLHRQDHKPEGDTWGVPAGKVSDGEEILETILRELKEETGFEISESKLIYFDKVYVRYNSYDFVYHIFHTKLDQQNDVKINYEEHKSFEWKTPLDALNMILIEDLDACIKLFYRLK